jgi:hypothetical protein
MAVILDEEKTWLRFMMSLIVLGDLWKADMTFTSTLGRM